MCRTAAVISVILACAVSAGAVSLPWAHGLNNRAACTKPKQIICSADCSEVLLCMGSDGGGYEPYVVEKCQPDMRCSAVDGKCVASEDSTCPDPVTDFTCNDAGAFPDPYDCTLYHVCLTAGGTAESGECHAGSAYNPLTSDCSLTTSDRVCTEGPINSCSRAGDMGVVPENPAIYYICTVDDNKLVPQMFKCHDGKIFDLDLAKCVVRALRPSPTASTPQSQEPPSSQSPDLPTDLPTEEPPLPTGQSTTTPISPGAQCSTVLEAVADPDDCRSFYRCGPDNKWIHITCGAESHYDPGRRGCAPGNCTSVLRNK